MPDPNQDISEASTTCGINKSFRHSQDESLSNFVVYRSAWLAYPDELSRYPGRALSLNMLLCAMAQVPQQALEGHRPRPVHEHVSLFCVSSLLNRDSDIKPAYQTLGLPVFTLGFGLGIST